MKTGSKHQHAARLDLRVLLQRRVLVRCLLSLHFQHWCFFCSSLNDKWQGDLWVLRVAAFLFFLVPLPIVSLLKWAQEKREEREGAERFASTTDASTSQTHRQRIPLEFQKCKGKKTKAGRLWDVPWDTVGWMGSCALAAYGRTTQRHFHTQKLPKHASVCAAWVVSVLLWSDLQFLSQMG